MVEEERDRPGVLAQQFWALQRGRWELRGVEEEAAEAKLSRSTKNIRQS